MSRAFCLAIDWGTTSMRAWALDVQGTVLGSYRGSRGMGALTPGEYPKELQLAQAALGLASATPTIICGMAGAAQGWVQVPYAELDTPFHVLPQKALQVPDTTGPVYILPGYCQRATGRQDVMRGEESILMGASAAGDGLYCLPGTHSKWAEINGGKLADAFGRTSARFCVISFDSDWLYPTAESRHVVHALNAAGAKVSFVELSAPHGHDSFLLEHEQLDRVMKGFING